MIIIMVLSKTKKAGDIMFCPNCGSKNPKDAAFCLRCGADLREASELVDELPQARPAPARPVWPWIALGVVALAALVLVLVVLLGGKGEITASKLFRPNTSKEDLKNWAASVMG